MMMQNNSFQRMLFGAAKFKNASMCDFIRYLSKRTQHAKDGGIP